LETAAKELEEIALAQTTRDAATGADERLNAKKKWSLAHQRLLAAFEHLGTTGTELLTAVSGLLEELWQRRTSEVAKGNPEEKEAFERARNDCRECLGHLLDGASALSTLDITAKGEEDGLQKLAKANRAVAQKIERLCNEPVRWCLGALTQEIAHASSGDMSALDAMELLSALLVAVKSRVVESPTVVSDAIEKALQAKLSDGGWINGRRLATDAPLSCSAATAWTLAHIIDEVPEVKVGDAALDEFVDWLKRRKVRLSTASAASGEPQGWTLEGRGRRDHIDLWVTVLSIQALIEIRTIHENRLGEICRERFKIVPAERKLEEIDPVDLALPHEMRLHHRLAKMARDILSRRRSSKAMYSLVLHGPPGSSKTAIAGALAKELLRFRPSDAAELIRITPADFTRQGEDNLDAEAARIFELLTHSRRVIVLFDEIDDLLRRREPFGKKRFFDLVVPAMLNRLQDLRDACRSQEIVFLLATNFIDTIEPALVRKGRVDDSIPLVYPDHRSRNFILRRNAESFSKKLELLQLGRTQPSDLVAAFLEPLEKIVALMDYQPWTSLNSFCEELVEVALQLVEENPDITQPDFEKRIREAAEELSAQNPPPPKALTYCERSRGFEGLLGQEFIAYTQCGRTLENIAAHRKQIKAILSLGNDGTRKKKKELRAAGKALESELKRFWDRRKRDRPLKPASAPSPSGGRRPAR
jgi:DNA polymerase III delta prime subunit